MASKLIDTKIRGRKFTKRFFSTNSPDAKRAELARFIAVVVAEDANTAHYVRDYLAGDFAVRRDYVQYMSNRIEGILAKYLA